MEERPMTDGELGDIEKRVAAASPGPWMRNGKTTHGWRIDDSDPEKVMMAMLLNPVAIVPGDANAEFIAEARYDVTHLVAEVRRLRLEKRGFQVMARKMLDQCLWQPMMEEGKYERASHDVECPDCRRIYAEHPQLPGFPTFHMLCSGKIIKT